MHADHVVARRPVAVATVLSCALLAGCMSPAAPTRPPAAPTTAPAAPTTAPAVQTRLEAPASVDGFPRTSNEDWLEVPRMITKSLETQVSAPTATLTEMYLGEGATDSVGISAVAGRVADPAKAVEAVIGPRPLKDLTDVEPGPLGGVVRCGTNREPVYGLWTTCVWADEGSVGMLSWLSLDMKDRRGDFAKYREYFQHTGA